MNRDTIVLAVLCAVLTAGCGETDSDHATPSAAGGDATAGSAGAAGVGGNVGGSDNPGSGGSSGEQGGSGGISVSEVGGDAGEGGAENNGGAGIGGDSSSAGEAGGSAGSSGSGGADTGLGVCLPQGEEKLSVQISGEKTLDLNVAAGALCNSLYALSTNSEDGVLGLIWEEANTFDRDTSIFVHVLKVTPGQLGTFETQNVRIFHTPDTWDALHGKCKVTITLSEKIGQDTGSEPARDAYKVSGSMACDDNWAMDAPDAQLKTFEFTTRVLHAKN